MNQPIQPEPTVPTTPEPPPSDRLYFKQLLSGDDIAEGDSIAQNMVNFIYLIGDKHTKQALVIDPAYDPKGILNILAADDMALAGVLATHYHPDHIGGEMMGFGLAGIADLLELVQVPIHVQKQEAEFVTKTTGVANELVQHSSGDKVKVGEIEVELIHTPGHTPGSQCFFAEGMLLSGDTLFLNGCGRTDLPGGSAAQIHESITQKLAKIPDNATLYPGHLYSPEPSASMGDTRRDNVVFNPKFWHRN